MTWAQATATPGAAAVADATLRLHRQLAAVLPPADLRGVLDGILDLFNRNLREAAAARDLRQKNTAVGAGPPTAGFYYFIFWQLGGLLTCLTSLRAQAWRQTCCCTRRSLPISGGSSRRASCAPG